MGNSKAKEVKIVCLGNIIQGVSNEYKQKMGINIFDILGGESLLLNKIHSTEEKDSMEKQFHEYIENVWERMVLFTLDDMLYEKVLEWLVKFEKDESIMIRLPISDDMYSKVSCHIDDYKWKRTLDALHGENIFLITGGRGKKDYEDAIDIRETIHSEPLYNELKILLENNRFSIYCKQICSTLCMNLYSSTMSRSILRLQNDKPFDMKCFKPLYGWYAENKSEQKGKTINYTEGAWDGYNPIERYLYEELFGYALCQCICHHIGDIYANTRCKKIRESFSEQAHRFIEKIMLIQDPMARIKIADLLLMPFSSIPNKYLLIVAGADMLRDLIDFLNEDRIRKKLDEIFSAVNSVFDEIDKEVESLWGNIANECQKMELNEWKENVYWEILKLYTKDRNEYLTNQAYIGFVENQDKKISLIQNEEKAEFVFSKKCATYAHFNYPYDFETEKKEIDEMGKEISSNVKSRYTEIEKNIFRKINMCINFNYTKG